MTNGPSNGGRRIRRIAIAAVTGVLLTVATNAGVAGADEFTPENSTPTISSPTVSATIQPDADASDTEYAYSATVGDADTLNDLSTVTLCLYQTTEGDATCTTTDPTNTVKLTWDQSTDSFTMDSGSSAYWALGSSPAPSSPTLSNTSGTFEYTFVVSEVTREGEWTAALTVDDGDATASDSTPTSTVNAYSEISTRTQQSFGTIASGGSATSSDSPTVTSNGTTTFSLTSGDFTDGEYTYTLETGIDPTVAPAAGEVTYDCHIGETFAEGSATRVGSTSTQVDGSTTVDGTVEDGVAVSNVCRVQQGGERPVSTYSFTVVNTIGNA